MSFYIFSNQKNELIWKDKMGQTRGCNLASVHFFVLVLVLFLFSFLFLFLFFFLINISTHVTRLRWCGWVFFSLDHRFVLANGPNSVQLKPYIERESGDLRLWPPAITADSGNLAAEALDPCENGGEKRGTASHWLDCEIQSGKERSKN